ncbi:MAG: O-methyltransferase [Bacteroidota bacterium]
MSKIIYQNQIDYLTSLRSEPDALIKEMEQYADANRIPILDWKAAELLEQIVLMLNPKRVLEIGTAIAYSSIRIARKLRKKGIVDTIEKSLDNISLASEFITKADLSGKINLIEGDALDIMPQLSKKYDLIFLDADKEDYEKLFYYSLVLLKKSGVIFIDNLLWHGYAASSKVPPNYKNSTKMIREFNKLFINQKALETTIIPVGDGIGIGVKI